MNLLYVGSLVNLMERSIGHASEKETGLHFQGYACGSSKIANDIKGKLRRGNVFISASPMVNTGLMEAPNGDHVSRYVNFTESPLVNPAFESRWTTAWYFRTYLVARRREVASVVRTFHSLLWMAKAARCY